MRDFKRHIAGFLACTLLLTSANISWLDLSPLIAKAAQGASELEIGLRNSVVDNYQAVVNLQKSVQDYVGTRLGKSFNDAVDTTARQSSDKIKDIVWNNLQGLQNIKVFNQKDIDATAQVKSGKWLSDTRYEAMAGTPTTENLFVTFGGTQWICDLQYRYVTADYIRKYHFDAGCYNYRYYTLGGVGNNLDAGAVVYSAQYEPDSAEDDPKDKTKGNYGYERFELSDEKVQIGNITTKSGAKFETNAADMGEKRELNTNKWTNCKWYSNVTSVQGDSASATAYYTPNQTRAILVKRAFVEAMQRLKDMWDKQDDNYRRDEGVWDSDYDGLDDKLSFMYTYGGMARHTSIQYDGENGRASSPGNAGALTEARHSVFNPCFVSYFYDWDGYSAGSLNTKYSSDVPTLKTIGDAHGTLDDIVSKLANGTTPDYFALHPEKNKVLKEAHNSPYNPANSTWTGSCTGYAEKLAKTFGKKAFVNIGDPNALLAFSDTFKSSSPDMKITNNMVNDAVFETLDKAKLQNEGYLEITYLYYKAMYSFLFNFGQFFYKDELNELSWLFEDLPGFDLAKISGNKDQVAANLAACFGDKKVAQMSSLGQYRAVVNIPFAIFPRGGDLDASMDDTDIVNGGVTDLNVGAFISLVESSENFEEYAYYVTVTIELKEGRGLDGEDEYLDYKYDSTEVVCGKHVGGGTDGDGLPICSVAADNDCTMAGNCKGPGVSTVVKQCDQTTGAGTECPNCHTTTGVHTTYSVDENDGHKCKTHTHYYSTMDKHEYIEDSDGVQYKFNYNRDIGQHDKIAYREAYWVNATNNITKSTGFWNEDIKSMSNSQVFGQNFKNVKWLDITAYTIWQMDKGETRGLSRLLASPVADASGKIITKAVDKLGYTVYNRNDSIRYDTDYLGLVRNLQSKYGRVANSIYYDSLGNSGSTDYNSEQYSINDYGDNLRTTIMAYNQSDVPKIMTSSDGGAETKYVNGDFHAYQVERIDSGETDDIYFKYNPYSQGGRSHASFNGFINQALARTLYYKYNKSGQTGKTDVHAKDHAYPYSNSLRIQGDYLSLNRTDGSTLTMAGHFTDTWELRTGQLRPDPDGVNTLYDGKQFRLMRDENNAGNGKSLGDYVSRCCWVPARLSYLLGRAGKSQIYDSNTVKSTDNTWIIHTYCGDINREKHTCWDSISPTIDSRCTIGNPTDMGSVNPDQVGFVKTHPDIFVLTDLLADPDAGITTAQVDGVTAKVINLGAIPLSDGKNTHDVMTDRDITMPYIGYLGDCDGTNANGEWTKINHYQAGTTTAFTPDDTFVSQDTVYGDGTRGVPYNTSYKGGFGQFGYHIDDNAPVAYTNVDNNNKALKNRTSATKDDFSSKYPWLQDLNVKRSLPNRTYHTGVYNVTYEKIGSENDCGNDTTAIHSTDNTLSVNARYLRKPESSRGQDDTQFTRTPNDIVIYNPVATRSAHVESLSTYLPDASNTGSNTSTKKAEYNGAYMDSFRDLVTRDQRVGLRYDGKDTSGTETYLTGSGISTGTLTQSNSYHWALKESSGCDTRYWKESDFKVTTNEQENEYTISNAGLKSITFSDTGTYKSGVYTVTMYDRFGKAMTFTKTFKDGDTITYNGSYLSYTDADLNVKLLYEEFQKAYKAYEELKGVTIPTDTRQFVPLHENMTMNIGANFKMHKGSLIKITLPLDGDYGGKLPMHISLDNDFTVDEAVEGNNYVCYIESNVDTLLPTLSFKADKEVHIMYYNNTFRAIDAMDVILVRTSDDGSSTEFAIEETGVTTKSFYDVSASWSLNYSGTASAAMNTRVVESYKVEVGVSAEISQCAILRSVASGCSVQYPMEQPHVVPSTDWRLYVLGWRTRSGKYMKSLADVDAMAETEEFDIQHYSDGHFVKKKELLDYARDNKLYVAKFNGNYYLTNSDCYDGTKRILPYNGIELKSGSRFDMIYFGPNASVQTDLFLPSVAGIISGSKGKIERNHAYGQVVSQKAYECVFRATCVTSDTTFAYLTQWSLNTAHRCALDSSSYEGCWEKVLDYELQFNTTEYTKVFADTLSLDDEFTIYWDNFDNLYQRRNGAEATASNVESIQKNLGRGWDNLKDSHDNAVTYKNEYDDAKIKNIPVWKKTDALASDYNNDAFTDTTKWIYNKYLIFNVDMYGFTTGNTFTLSNGDNDSAFDPTTPAFKENGKPNNIVVIPAGTKVYCGYYKGDSKEDDNAGRFYDYGNNGQRPDTAGASDDPNKADYTYHFWCPLSTGEALETATVEFVVNAINSTEVDENGIVNKAGGKQSLKGDDSVLDTGMFLNPYALKTAGAGGGKIDEWGELIYKAATPFMKNNVHRLKSVRKAYVNENENSGEALNCEFTQTETTRYANSINSDVLSVAGRLGGLTVVDSEDPRYQDTFKWAESGADFAISPIVRAITRYSNDEWNVADRKGSTQNRYLCDVIDVRGRISKLYDKLSLGGSGYKVTQDNSLRRGTLNTYGSQWFLTDDDADAMDMGNKQDVKARDVLPMAYDFNIHSELDNTRSKLGYDMLCSMFSIGNYYGSAGPRNSSDTTVNNNLDYGQTKVQVMPRYIFIPKQGQGEPEAVDVYIRKGTDYALINAGSIYGSKEIEEANGNGNGGPYFLEAAYTSNSVVSINTNKEDKVDNKYVLSSEMLRKLVTTIESTRSGEVMVTKDSAGMPVQLKKGITKTMLDKNSYGDSSTIGGEGLTYEYIYGNSQIMFMREYNRTFVGGQLTFFDSLNSTQKYKHMEKNAEVYGQKWYFNLGLPASSVFVKHGEDPITKNILNGREGYILVVLDIYAIGEKFITRYQSPLSQASVKVDYNTEYEAKEWNVYEGDDPHLIPVSFYDLSQEDASSDMDNHGTH